MSLLAATLLLAPHAALALEADLNPIDQNLIKEGATQPRWLRLLQYERRFDGYESRVDNPEFFISPDGKTSPELELKSTIQALQNKALHHAGITQPAGCAFPARARFIRESLKLNVPKVDCPDYDNWRNAIDPVSVTLIFTTAYANNPASMFGHTFLKLNHRQENTTSGAALFDYGVGFSAAVPADDSKGVFYAWKALFGGYPGVFSVSPYYMKITEYASMENRDLWEYELNFTANETSWLIANLWELFGSAQIDYYFAKENCSFEILALLEAAKLDWSLTTTASIIALPADTVRILSETPDAIKDVNFRPAARRRYQAELAALSPDQKNDFKETLKRKELLPTTRTDPRTLGALATYLTYIQQSPDIGLKPAEHSLLRSVLVARAKLGVGAKIEDSITADNRPDIGHKPRRLEIFARRRSTELPRYGLSLGGGYHNLSEKSAGYEDHLQINYLEGELEYDPSRKKFYLAKFTLADILSLNPYDSLDAKFSWSIHAGYDTLLRCNYCRAMSLSGGGGFALDVSVFSLPVISYVMLQALVDMNLEKLELSRFGPAVQAGAIIRMSSNHNLSLYLQSTSDLNKGISAVVNDYEANLRYVFHAQENLDLYVNWQEGSAVLFEERRLFSWIAGGKVFF